MVFHSIWNGLHMVKWTSPSSFQMLDSIILLHALCDFFFLPWWKEVQEGTKLKNLNSGLMQDRTEKDPAAAVTEYITNQEILERILLFHKVWN